MTNEILCEELIIAIKEVCREYKQTSEFEDMLMGLVESMANGVYNESDLNTLIEKVVISDGY